MNPLNLAAWNVRSLLDNSRRNRPGRRTAASTARFCPRSKARPSGPAGDKDDPRCRRVDRPSPRPLQDEDPPTATQETSIKELDQRLANLPVVPRRRRRERDRGEPMGQLRCTIQSTAPAVLGRARRQHQDWFDDNDADISNLFAEKESSAQNLSQQSSFLSWFPSCAKATAGNSGRLDGSQGSGYPRAEHFRGVPNRPSTISDAAITCLPHVKTNVDPDLAPIFHEAIKAVDQLPAWKPTVANVPGIRIAYRMDGQLLNHRRMHFQSRVPTTIVHEPLSADDCAPNATSEGDMQRSMDLFHATRDNFSLIINTEKTVVMHRPPPNVAYNTSQINVTRARLQAVDNSTYRAAPKSTMNGPPDFQDQQSLKLPEKHHVESSRPPP
ncbi:hypothetical protein SprV_0100118700 [Sparganum proliferum]